MRVKRRAYPSKHRKKLAQLAKKRKPWRRSSGPKTTAGKSRSCQNAVKHGYYGAEMAALRQILRTQKAFVKTALGSTSPHKNASTKP